MTRISRVNYEESVDTSGSSQPPKYPDLCHAQIGWRDRESADTILIPAVSPLL
ncbi:MAG: hypothetical protein J07HR59_00597, partial [Halorubrum sp. J07HR59]